jgi:Uma2 family endonuclease
MAAQSINFVSANDYLKVERSATEKHELHNGQVVAMSGASLPHNHMVSNLFSLIGPFLKSKGCKVFTSDLRVHIPSADSFTYPDLSIVCGKPEMLDDAFDTLTNPSVLIEVMSRSTEKYDRGTKFFYYMQIPSLREYILLDSNSVFIQLATRQADNSWKFEELNDLSSSFTIKTIEKTIALAEVYDNVAFR